MQTPNIEYAGFWVRVGAAFLDTLFLILIILPLLLAIYGPSYLEASTGVVAGPLDFFISYVFPAIAVIVFWIYKQATPGKMIMSARIVDAATGKNPSSRQLIGRYFAYFVSTFPLGLGLIWVAFDKRKQGWHDKLAGTVVVREKSSKPS